MGTRKQSNGHIKKKTEQISKEMNRVEQKTERNSASRIIKRK